MRYFEKRNKLTLYLFMIFLNFVIAIVFSWLSKVIVLYSGIEYVYNNALPDPGTSLSWLLLRIIDFRFSFVFVTISTFFSYILKVSIFEKGYNQIHKTIVIIYGCFTVIYSLLAYQRGNTFLDVLAFLFVLIYLSMIYIPFLIRSFNTYKKVNEQVYKKAFLSLVIMSLSFMLVFLSFLIDRILILLGDPGFTIFYFMGWTLVVIGIMGAYFGYIRPKDK